MKVVTLNQDEFGEKCKELFSTVEVRPDLIVGILNGGGYVVEQIKKETEGDTINFKSVMLQRGSGFKNNYIVKFFLKVLPYAILDRIRIFESMRAKKTISRINRKEILKINIGVSQVDKINDVNRILIIDDAIDTGKTMTVVKNNLNNVFPDAKIEVAVISWTIESSIVKPDYFLFKDKLVRFPWSKDYKGKDFEEKYFSS